MSTAIYKYEVEPWNPIAMPIGAIVLSAGAQGDAIFVWARVDTTVDSALRGIVAIPTGHFDESCHDAAFIGTTQMDNGLVFHVFDRGEV